MTIATGARHSMAYVLESVFGTTPANPIFKALRHNSTTLGLTKQTFKSNELRSDRQISDFRHGTREIGGDFVVELSAESFDDMLEAAMCGTWTPTVTETASTISASSTDNSINDSASGFPALAANDLVYVSGFATSGNNGLAKVVSRTTGKIVLSGITLTTEVAGQNVTVSSYAATLKAGVVRRSFTFERHFADITEYIRFMGCELDGFTFTVKPNGMVEATFSVIGQDQTQGTSIISGATYLAPTTTDPFDGFSGTIEEGGSGIATVTECMLKLSNGLKAEYAVGSQKSVGNSIARSDITGQVTSYFEDTSLLLKFVNETATTVEFTLTDGTRGYDFSIPKAKYTGGKPDVTNDGPITLALPFQAILDSTTSTNMTITRS